jgi:F-type H+-transporting ATPase subunit a
METHITPDSIILWRYGPVVLNATILFTWVVMALLVGVSLLATRNLSVSPRISRWQNFMEIVVSYIRGQVRDISRQDPDPFIPFLGTLYLFIALANFLFIVPGYHAPTESLYTTGALAISVFFAVPGFGIARQGVAGYLRHYLRPTVLMLPFNIIGEFSRTLALAMRLFGNMMSETLTGALLISFTPLVLPVVMQAFGLLIGQIQAYIFAVLATVYISAAVRNEGEAG